MHLSKVLAGQDDSLAQLASALTKAKLQRSLARFRSPRRLAVSILAILLALVWIGQAVLGIFLRESADPERLALWIPLSLTAYALWNVLKITFQTPVEPFEWTESEREWLIGAPIRRADLIKFRFRTIFVAALLKASIFALVMIPDLSILPLGLIGMLGGLLFIDLIRMSVEVFVYGLNQTERIAMRCVVGALALLSGGFAVDWAIQNSDVGLSLASAASLGFLLKIGLGFVEQTNTWFGVLVMTPFQLSSDVVLANQISTTILLKLVFSFGIVWVHLRGLISLDQRWLQRRHQREVSQFDKIKTAYTTRVKANAKIRKLKLPVRFGGSGPLAWRQFHGARKYQVALIAALSVPFVLNCLPALSELSGLAMVMNVVAGLACYSILLLPAAFKFDFRRDVNRMSVLKSLPISPLKIVVGQLSAPIMLTSIFQAVVLLTVMIINPYHPFLLLVSLAILLPFNVFIFGFENLFFIWFPHRLQEEGIQVFLRSILAFTAKGFLFVIALVVSFGWLYVAKSLADLLFPDSTQTATTVFFMLGMWASMGLLSSISVALLTRAFSRFDPSRDLSGVT